MSTIHLSLFFFSRSGVVQPQRRYDTIQTQAFVTLQRRGEKWFISRPERAGYEKLGEGGVGGEERQKSDIGGCLFGSVSMMDVEERKRKSCSSLWEKREWRDSGRVAGETGASGGLDETIFQIWCVFCSVFVFVHISCIWVLCVLYSVAQLDWTKRVFYFYFFTFSCSGSFQFFLYFTGLIPHPD